MHAEQNFGTLLANELPVRDKATSRYDALRSCSCFWIKKALAGVACILPTLGPLHDVPSQAADRCVPKRTMPLEATVPTANGRIDERNRLP
jgi:hypothetical protein